MTKITSKQAVETRQLRATRYPNQVDDSLWHQRPASRRGHVLVRNQRPASRLGHVLVRNQRPTWRLGHVHAVLGRNHTRV